MVRGRRVRGRVRVGVDRVRGRRLARDARRRRRRMVVQRIRRRMVKHVRVRAGRVMVMMVMVAAGHHARHRSENGRGNGLVCFISGSSNALRRRK